jgi:hypothetical protein
MKQITGRKIIVIIIIVGKTALFEPYASLENSGRLHLVFTFWISFKFFTEQGRQPCVQPQLRGSGGLIYAPLVAELHPREKGFLSVAFYESQGYGVGIRSRLHKRRRTIIQTNIFQLISQ